MRYILMVNILLVFLPQRGVAKKELLSGLYFSSYEVVQDKRTSLNLTPDEPYVFPKGFSIEFDANFRQGDGYYGYVFRMIGNEHTNIDFVSNFSSLSSNFSLVLKNQTLFSYKWSDIPNGGFDRWLKIKIDVDVPDSVLTVSFNGMRRKMKVAGVGDLKKFNIVFGSCRNNSFSTTDVCPMLLKNIRIYDHNGKLFRYWKLSRHGHGQVYDEVANAKAVADNPYWIIDRHVKWEKIKEIKIDNLYGIAKDKNDGRLFFVNDKSVYVVSVDPLKIDTIPFAGGCPYHDSLSKQIIYNEFTNELWSFSFDKSAISRFNFKTRQWSSSQPLAEESDFAHQNKFISPFDSSLVSILGYGHYLYKSKINHYNRKLHHWEQIDRSNQIEPRYLASAGFMNNREVLVFGGYGSKSGQQELSPEFYYDLYLFDMKDYTFKKLWTLPTPASPYVPGEDLIYDEQSRSFYTLVYNSVRYNTSLRLAKFSIDQPKGQFFDDSIPYRFLDTESWNALFLNKAKQELIAVTTHNADIKLYTIAYPPLMPSEVYQNGSDENDFLYKLAGLLAILLLSGAGIYVYLRKRKRTTDNVGQIQSKVDHQGIDPLPVASRRMESSILFLGGFQIYNRKGIDITSDFSPTLKQLFLFIFLCTIRKGKGVSSTKLDEVLWYDKSKESARNNRNVNISKLRSALDEVGGVEVINENSFWKINIGEQVYCDYVEALFLIEKTQSSGQVKEEVYRLISLLLAGELLPNVRTDWSDPFKSAFTNDVIDCLIFLMNSDVIKKDFSLRYHMTECVFIYDPLNEEALTVKCSILDQVGKRSLAKHVYDSFCKDYKQMLGVPYSNTFNDIILK